MRPEEKRLLALYSSLGTDQQQMLLDFMLFLQSRTVKAPVTLPEPISRPETESVVKAIKRLMASYPMLERSKLLHETSAVMTQHIVQGKPAKEAIDELEVVFKKHVEQHQQKLSRTQ